MAAYRRTRVPQWVQNLELGVSLAPQFVQNFGPAEAGAGWGSFAGWFAVADDSVAGACSFGDGSATASSAG